MVVTAEVHAQRLDEGALAGTRDAGDTQSQGLARVRQAGGDDLLGQLLVFREGALHQGNGLAQRHTVALQDAIDIPVERHQLLLVAAQTLQ